MPDNKETDLKNGLSPEEIELWEGMTRDVKPLEGREARAPVSKPKKKAPPVGSGLVVSHVPFALSTPPKPKVRGREIDGNTERRLQKGEIPIEGKLDLHGMNQGEARQALFSFIQSAQAAGKRCVLVVTGKGGAPRTSENWFDREPGVLKVNTPAWLREGALSDVVLRAVSAQPRDGGSGALYVYLRRNRDYTNSPEPGG